MDPELFETIRLTARERWAEIWAARDSADALNPEDRQLLKLLEEHREFYPWWDRLAHLGSRKVFIDGDKNTVNPVMHVVLHQIVESQLANRDPEEIATALSVLEAHGFTRHRAVHLLAHVEMIDIHDTMVHREPFDRTRYRGRLALLTDQVEDPDGFAARLRRIGRNDPCPCLSGKKYKKCCRDLFPLPVEPGQWHVILSGGGFYCPPDYARVAADGDPVVLLQNTSAIAEMLESFGDLEGALGAHQYNIRWAEESDDPDLLAEAVDELVEYTESHLQFANAGIAAIDRYGSSIAEDVDDEAMLALTRAELIAGQGRAAEAYAAIDAVLARTDLSENAREEVRMRRDELADFFSTAANPEGARDKG